jgi:hypothetical protein
LKDVKISINPKAAKKADIGVITVKYQKKGDSAFVSVPRDVGYYDVSFDVTDSVKYTGNTFPAQTLTINKASAPLKREDMDITGVGDVTYDGLQKIVTIDIPKLGYRAPANAIWYGGSATAPRDAGEYEITFDIVLDAIWSGASRNYASMLNIKPRGPSISDFGKAVIIDADKEYDDVAARVTAPSGSGAAPVNGTIGLNYKNKATGVVTSGSVKNAGTYELYLTLKDDDKNWLATDGDGIPLGQELTIRKRRPVQEDFITPVLDEFAYAMTQAPSFVRDPARAVPYPTATAFRSNFYASMTATGPTALNLVQAMPRANLFVRIDLAANLNDWEGGPLYWPYVVKDVTFDTVDGFVRWYNRLRAGNTVYEAKFKSSTPTITTAADIKKIALAIKDDGTYGDAPNSATTHGDYWPTGTPDNPIDPKFTSTPNANKRLSLNLSGTSIGTLTTLVSADNGFKDCVNLRAVDLSNTTEGNSPIAAIDANTFDGCINLETLKLGAVTTVGATAAQSFISGLSALKYLDLNAVATNFTNQYLGENVALEMLTVGALTFTTNSFELSKIKGLTLGENATLAADAFLNSKSLAKVVFPANFGTKSIPARAFKGCAALKEVTFPKTTWNTTGTIEDGAFEGCSVLTEVNLPIIPAPAINKNAFGGADAALTTLTLGGATGAGTILADTAAFAGKANLRTVNLGITITALTASSDANDVDKPGLFEDCTRLRTVNWPTGTGAAFVTIGTRAFKGCGQLFTDIPATVNAIGASAFEGCASIESITIPVAASSPLARIFPKAFKGTGLKTLTIPQSILEINEEAFANCTSLTKVTLANNGTSTTLKLLGATGAGTAGGSFAGCTSLSSFGKVETVDGVTYPAPDVCVIPDIADFTARVDSFKDTAFKKVKINTNATTDVPGAAFSVSANRTSNIATLEVSGVAVTSGLKFGSGDDAVPSITKIIWDVNAMAATVNTFAGTGVTTLEVKRALSTAILGTFPANKPTTLELTTASQVADVALFADAVLASVVNVRIGTAANNVAINIATPDASTPLVTSGLFNPAVKNITFLGAVGTLGANFGAGLTGTTRTNGLNYRFEGNTGNIPSAGAADNVAFTAVTINTVYLGPNVASIGTGNFTSPLLTAINVDSANTYYGNNGTDGVLYGKTGGALRTLMAYPGGKQLPEPKAYVIHEEVRTIGVAAFRSNADMVTLTIPAGVTSIDNTGSGAFNGMSNLKTVNYYATNVPVASGSAFPTTVEVVNIGDRVQVIPAAFLGANAGIGDANGINSAGVFTVPASVTTIGSGAFNTATRIKEVRFNATDLLLTSVDAFKGCSSITKLVIGPGVKVIPASSFEGTGVIKDIDLSSVTSIGNFAFADCFSLIGIEIPASCEFIGEGAFDATDPGTSIGCNQLVGVGIRGTRTSIDPAAFKENDTFGGKIDVLYAGGANPGFYSWQEDPATAGKFGWVFRPGL